MGATLLVGLVRAVLMVGPAMLAGRLVRQRLAPAWGGGQALLASTVLGLAVLELSAELVGALDAFELIPLVAAGLVALGLSTLVPQRASVPSAEAPKAAAPGTWMLIVGLAAVAGQWATRLWDAVTDGISEYDSLHYHLPHAARFVQLGSLTDLHFVSVDGVPNMFHPSGSDLLHALGMIAFDTDVASLVLNVGWGALGVLAAWRLGARWGVGHLSALGFLAVLAMPFTALSAGSALSDVPSYACLLASLALLAGREGADSGDRLVCTAFGAVAGGLAVAMKLTMLAPVGALSLAVLWSWRRQDDRVRGWAAWLGPLALTGSFWYLRNVAAAGSPLPSLRLPGLPHATFASVERYGFSVVSYLDEPDVLRHWYLPGLSTGMTPAWPVVAILLVWTLVAALRRPAPALTRCAAIVVAATLALYVVTPTTAFGLPGRPTFFALNLRYAFPAIVVGFAVAPVLARRSPLARRLVPCALLAVLLASELGGRTPPPGFSSDVPAWLSTHAEVGLLTGAGVLAAGLLMRWRQSSRAHETSSDPRPLVPRAVRWAPVGMAVVVGAVAASVVADRYEERRYAGDAIVQALDDASPARVAIGGFDLQYPYYGSELENHVQHIGDETPHGGFDAFLSCRAWRGAILEGRYRFVVVPEQPLDSGPPSEWIMAWPDAHEVLRYGGRVLYRVDESSEAAACE